MSFVPSTSNRDVLAVLAVVVVAVLAIFLRRSFGGSSSPASPVSRGPEDAEPGVDFASGEEDEDDQATMVAVTSDGWAFMPDGDEVQLVPPATEEGGEETDPTDSLNPTAMLPHPRHRHLPVRKPGEHLDAGDFTGARVVRGAAGGDPWRLEALGHDGEYRSWAFETAEDAGAALRLLETRIVQPPLDADGVPRPPGDEQYAAAAALTEEGIAELAMDPGDEGGDEPRKGPWVSDRR